MADLFSKWKDGLARTSKATFGRLATALGATEITEETWDELEAILVQADLGVDTTQGVIKSMQRIVDDEGIIRSSDMLEALRRELLNRLEQTPKVDLSQNQPAVVLLVGVNGSGKTTTAAKLGRQFANQGKKVLLAAADTYRAAAIDQLQVWGDRLNLPVIAGQPNSDPGAVAYDAVQSAIARKTDILLIDTAGRLHTRFNLMEELKKVHRVVGKAMPGAPHAVWLVLDATTGQNALNQAKAFRDAVKINGVILAKLDSSARGGMAFAIKTELGLPILYAGLGEKPEDLQVFDREAFVNGIFTTR
ncbi:MAG TPA: signal recognition particle-docking protein FtsY [Anaerolineaceae bacterium]